MWAREVRPNALKLERRPPRHSVALREHRFKISAGTTARELAGLTLINFVRSHCQQIVRARSQAIAGANLFVSQQQHPTSVLAKLLWPAHEDARLDEQLVSLGDRRRKKRLLSRINLRRLTLGSFQQRAFCHSHFSIKNYISVGCSASEFGETYCAAFFGQYKL